MTIHMSIIAGTEELAEFCTRAANFQYITVDTEFIREKTYWPHLCLVQIGTPGEAKVIDALSHGIDLSPLFKLFANRDVLKVFHAARQDIEIFVHLSGEVPRSIFDTQIAAMVCGYGDAVGYDRLVSDIAKVSIDKSMRFTDWAKRPLTNKQIEYALGDVTHLREVYAYLSRKLEDNGRTEWLSEEMSILSNTETYVVMPEDAWKRLKIRNKKPAFIANLQVIAEWREKTAQKLDVPRNRVLKDDSLTEIATHTPRSIDELFGLRALKRDRMNSEKGRAILQILDAVRRQDGTQYPKLPEENIIKARHGPSIDLLKVLLKHKCDTHKVAQKLIASTRDIEELARNDHAHIPALAGWRFDVYGKDALRLKRGEIALTAQGPQVRIIKTE